MSGSVWEMVSERVNVIPNCSGTIKIFLEICFLPFSFVAAVDPTVPIMHLLKRQVVQFKLFHNNKLVFHRRISYAAPSRINFTRPLVSFFVCSLIFVRIQDNDCPFQLVIRSGVAVNARMAVTVSEWTAPSNTSARPTRHDQCSKCEN